MGAARDIVENVGVPRFYWSDFPLGHSAGKPNDVDSQTATVAGALSLFDQAVAANITLASEQIWSDDPGWKDDFMDVSQLDASAFQKLRDAHEAARSVKHR